MSEAEQLDTKEDLFRATIAQSQGLEQVSICCPLLRCCDEFIKISDLENHCLQYHTDCLYYDVFCFEKLKYGACFTALLVKNGVLFLIYCYIYKEDQWFSVFCLESSYTNLEYRITLTSPTDSSFQICNTYPVLPFVEEEHCPRCMFGKCSLKFHKYSRANGQPSSRFDHIQNSLDINLMKPLQGKEFDCLLEILGEFEIAHPTDNDNVIRDAITCPFCYKYYVSKVNLCPQGHGVCNKCYEWPMCFCGSEYSETRCIPLENIAEHYQLSCENKDNGCPFTGNAPRMNLHEQHCSYKYNRCT